MCDNTANQFELLPSNIPEAPVSAPAEPEPWQMTLAEWLSQPRQWVGPAERLPATVWCRAHGFTTLLDDHGDFRHPNGISKIMRRRMDERLRERQASQIEGVRQYDQAVKRDEIPMVTPLREIRGDGTDTERDLARARVYHRVAVRKARLAGLPVPFNVAAEYGLVSVNGLSCPAAQRRAYPYKLPWIDDHRFI